MNFYWSIELSLSLSLDQSLLNNSDLIKRDKLSSQHGALRTELFTLTQQSVQTREEEEK